MTWNEVVDCLTMGTRVLSVGRESVVLSYAGDEDQRIRIELVRVFDEPWVLFLSPIVEETRAHLRDALALNMTLGIGALAIEQKYLVIRAVCSLVSLDNAGLQRYVNFAVDEALRLRRLHDRTSVQGPGDVFRD